MKRAIVVGTIIAILVIASVTAAIGISENTATPKDYSSLKIVKEIQVPYTEQQKRDILPSLTPTKEYNITAEQLQGNSFVSADSFHKKTVTEAALGIRDANIKHHKPVIKTFDTKLGTVTALTNGGKIGELPDPVKLNQEIKYTATKQLPEASPLGGIPISGTLPPYSADEWGTVYLRQGETVTVSLSWYPSASEIIVGLKNIDTGVISWGPGITGGSGTWYLSAWLTGSYNIVILNHSGETVTYSGYVSW